VTGATGCVLAAALGVAATTNAGLLLAAGIAASALCVGAIALYARDPIMAFIGLWLFEVFDAPLSAAVGYFSPAGEAVRQADELLVLLFVGLTVLRSARSSTRLPSLRLIVPGVGFAMFGVIGAIDHSVPFSVAAVGTWLGLKLWISLAVSLLLPWKRRDISRVYRAIVGVGLLIAVIGLLDYLTHAAISRALHTSIYRFESGSLRGEAVHSIFPHPGEFSLYMSLLFAFTFARFAGERNRRDLLLALCFAGSVMLSLRLKGFLSLACIVVIVTMAHSSAAMRTKVAIGLIGALLVIGAYAVEGNVISKQIATYTSSESSARAKLYTTSTRIASNEFPVGAGFGRFATYPSRLYYSPVYQEYGLNQVWGLSREFPNFIDDTSWPGVIGEAGYGGFLFYAIGILALIFVVLRRMRSSSGEVRWLSLAVLCAMAAFLVDSLGDPTLFDWLATTFLALMIGPALVAKESAAQAPSSTPAGHARRSSLAS
jgi:hypothetical protein